MLKLKSDVNSKRDTHQLQSNSNKEDSNKSRFETKK